MLSLHRRLVSQRWRGCLIWCRGLQEDLTCATQMTEETAAHQEGAGHAEDQQEAALNFFSNPLFSSAASAMKRVPKSGAAL